MGTIALDFRSTGGKEAVGELKALEVSLKNIDKLSGEYVKALQDQAKAIKAQETAARESLKTQQQQIKLQTDQQRLAKSQSQADAAAARATAAKAAAEAAAQRQEQARAQTIEGLIQRQRALDQSTQQIAQRYVQLRSSGQTAAQALNQVQREFGATGAAASAAAAEIQRIDSDFTRLTATVGAIGAATAAVTGRLFKDGADAFLGFETQFKGFAVLAEASGSSAEEIAAVNETAKQLGATTPKTAQEVAGLAKELSRAGLSTTDINDALAGIVQGSVAAEEDLGRVGEIVGQALSQFQESGDQAQRFVDILITGANASATSVDQLGEALSYVGGQSKASNQSIETTTLLLGILANAGIQGSRAGTNLGAVFDNLKTASADLANGVDNDAVRAFKLLNVDIRNADGTLRDFGETLPELRESFANLTPEQRETIEQNLFGERGGRAFTALMGATAESVEVLTSQLDGAAGASERQSEQLRRGLSGALIELSSAYEGFSAAVFSTFAPALEVLTRAATALLSGFQALPAPVQAALSVTVAFAGVLGAAAATLAAYNLLNLSRIKDEALVALGIVRSTVAQSANTVATNAAIVARGALALATGKANAQQLQFAKGLGAATVTVGAFAAAGATVALVADTFLDITENARETEKKIIDIEEALLRYKNIVDGTDLAPDGEVDLDTQKAELAIKKTQNDLGAFRNFVDGVRTDFFGREGGRGTETLFGFEIGSTELEARITQDSQAFSDLSTKVQEVEANAIAMREALKGGEEIDPAAAQALIDTIDASTAALEAQETTNADQERARDAQIARLGKQRVAIEAVANAEQKAANDATEAEAKANIEKQKAIDLAEQQRDIARDIAEEAFDEQQFEQQIGFDEESFQRSRAFGDEQRLKQEAFEAQQNAERKALEDSIRADTKAFDASQNAEKLALEQQLQAEAKAFNDSEKASQRIFDQQQQQAAQAFSDRQREDARLFQAGQQSEEEAFRKRLGEQEKAIDRQVQLELAKNARERRDLEKQFAKEDEATALREQLSAPLKSEEASFEEQQRLAAQEFENKQRAEQESFELSQQESKLAFEEQLAAVRAAFEETQNQRKLELESQLQLAKEGFEEQLAEKRRLLDAELAVDQLAFDRAREDEQRAFDVEQQRIQREFDKEQEIQKEEFEAEQRRLDEESAQRVQETLANGGQQAGNAIVLSAEQAAAALAGAGSAIASNAASLADAVSGVGGTVPAFRTGGFAEPGLAQLHKDEYVMIPEGGAYVMSQRKSRALDRQIASRRALPTALSSGRGAGVAEVAGLRQQIARLERAIAATKFEKQVNIEVQPPAQGSQDAWVGAIYRRALSF